ncbi:hypothetical protein [Sphingomonas quercus]|uniref:Uncharacterized protein n=1 Tax=Sphingomonas quercus TaxID=2842451 RepID=A0ABS6BKW3_9SPHN|nr:hypothetical protein [Sphingomonas quercus]MBU3078262.1 hypothetical protein [Sphingomonas quercus]
MLAISLSAGLAAIDPGWTWEILPWTVLMTAFGFIGSAARARSGPGPVSD